MGLEHPVDLDAWRQAHRHRSWRFWRDNTPSGLLLTAGPDPDILVAVDNASATSRAALIDVIGHVPPERVAVLAGADLRPHLPTATWQSKPWSPQVTLPTVATVLVTHAVFLGQYAAEHAAHTGARLLVIQHGILTPQTPPLPPNCELLTWSACDAEFLIGARTDIGEVHVVGAQLLAKAAASRSDVCTGVADQPIYLGQLHGSELPRRDLARAAIRFCLRNQALYRPHPSETDLRSRWWRRSWARRGLQIEVSGRPLLDLAAPVVAVYSTGVLEAAAAGLPAWVDFPSPPDWLTDLWQRYEMGPWGGSPTAVTGLIGGDEPALAAATIVGGNLAEVSDD